MDAALSPRPRAVTSDTSQSWDPTIHRNGLPGIGRELCRTCTQWTPFSRGTNLTAQRSTITAQTAEPLQHSTSISNWWWWWWWWWWWYLSVSNARNEMLMTTMTTLVELLNDGIWLMLWRRHDWCTQIICISSRCHVNAQRRRLVYLPTHNTHHLTSLADLTTATLSQTRASTLSSSEN